jgi:hypothetical protein
MSGRAADQVGRRSSARIRACADGHLVEVPSPPDPAEFSWGAAVEHIAYHLQLPDAGLSRLAGLQRSAGRGER